MSDKWKISYCAAYSLYIIYLTKVIGTASKSVVLKLYYQRASLHKWRYLWLEKILFDNSVRFISKVGHSQSEPAPHISEERKKIASNNILPEKNKEFIKIITGEAIRTIE